MLDNGYTDDPSVLVSHIKAVLSDLATEIYRISNIKSEEYSHTDVAVTMFIVGMSLSLNGPGTAVVVLQALSKFGIKMVPLTDLNTISIGLTGNNLMQVRGLN